MLQYQFVVGAVDDRLIRTVHEWMKEAVFFIGGSWYSNCKETRNLASVSSDLQLRWLNFRTTRVAIEPKSLGFRWLGGYYFGNYDPMILDCFHKSQITEGIIATVESVALTYLPMMSIAKCHCCEERFGLVWEIDKWRCEECAERFAHKIINRAGFVYVFGSVESGYYKIGQSQNPPNRLIAYRRLGLPFSVEMVHVVPVDDALRAESELHGLFTQESTGAEWFKLSANDLAWIKKLSGYVAGKWVTQ